MYVIIEGIDTCGKSTQIGLLKQYFKDAIFTKEPGGTEIGLKIREMVLGGEFKSKVAELFMFLADRAEHYEKVVKLNEHKLIISDRGFISGISYALGFPTQITLPLNLMALQNQLPNKVIFLELDENTLKLRLSNKDNDAIEARGIEYLLNIQSKIKETILQLELNALIIDANDNIDAINKKIIKFIEE